MQKGEGGGGHDQRWYGTDKSSEGAIGEENIPIVVYQGPVQANKDGFPWLFVQL